MKGFYDKLQTIMQTTNGGTCPPRNKTIGATNDVASLGTNRGGKNNFKTKGSADFGSGLSSNSVASLFGFLCVRTLPLHPCSIRYDEPERTHFGEIIDRKSEQSDFFDEIAQSA